MSINTTKKDPLLQDDPLKLLVAITTSKIDTLLQEDPLELL